MSSPYISKLIALLAVIASGPAFAQAGCKAPSADCVVVGEWDLSVGFGYGKRSNPVRGNSDIPLFVIPQLSYYGKRFFLENLELGYTLHEGEAQNLNLIATPGYDRVFFMRDDLQNYFVTGLASSFTAPEAQLELASSRPRRTTYLVGPEWLFNVGLLTGQLNALYEATGRHKGYEVRAAVAAPLVQAADSLVLSAGFTWKSSQVVDYYYGVDGYYAPDSALSPFIKLGYSRAITDRWTVNALVHYEYLGDAIADSPIIAERAVTTVFAGVVFKIF